MVTDHLAVVVEDGLDGDLNGLAVELGDPVIRKYLVQDRRLGRSCSHPLARRRSCGLDSQREKN